MPEDLSRSREEVLPTLDQEYSPLSPAHIAHPYAFYATARKTDPVFFSTFLNAWVLTRYEDVITVLRDHQRFAIAIDQTGAQKLTPQVLGLLGANPLFRAPKLVSIDPPEHTRLRSSLTRALSAQRIASLEPSIRAIADRLIGQMMPQGKGDFLEQFASPYPIQVIGSLLNVPQADMGQIQRWSEDMMTLLYAAPPASEQLPYAQHAVALLDYIYAMAEQRRKDPQDDLISDLLRAVEAGEAPLTPLEVASLLHILLLAGFETTVKFLGNCLFRLLSERQHWEALLTNPGSIPQVVEEALRFDSPVLTTLRIAREEAIIGGKTIQEGARVQVVLASANHDETKFSDPETFHGAQEPHNRHLTFGYGVHFCIGSPLARLEGRVALEQLSRRLPSLRLASGQDGGYTPNLVLHGLRQLLVEWDSSPKTQQVSSTSPVADGKVVEGRFMLSESAYALPKDEQEINRLDLQHLIVHNAFGSNFRAPLENPQAILDVGTGTGRWAREMAQAFPSAWVVGCDLVESETSKDVGGLPPQNYQFVKGDVLKGLPFDNQSFDFVHQRFLILGIPAALWQKVLAELLRLTKTGGWVELVESGTQVHNAGPIGQRSNELVRAASQTRGIDFSNAPRLRSLLQDAGFINISARSVDVPVGTWGGELGTRVATNLMAGARALKPLVASQGLAQAQEYDQNLSLLHQEWEHSHSTLSLYVAYAQRPS
jgi:cytochrome P450/ubiquinone/menaquinone biosynthesis C-methylase UbiE